MKIIIPALLLLLPLMANCQSNVKNDTTGNKHQKNKKPNTNYNNGLKTTLIDPVETSAKYPGGDQALVGDIMKNLIYPTSEHPLKGRVTVNFIVERNGSIDNFKVVRSLRADYDSAAVNAVKKLSKFSTPGKNLENEAKVSYSVPVTFYQQKSE